MFLVWFLLQNTLYLYAVFPATGDADPLMFFWIVQKMWAEDGLFFSHHCKLFIRHYSPSVKRSLFFTRFLFEHKLRPLAGLLRDSPTFWALFSSSPKGLYACIWPLLSRRVYHCFLFVGCSPPRCTALAQWSICTFFMLLHDKSDFKMPRTSERFCAGTVYVSHASAAERQGFFFVSLCLFCVQQWQSCPSTVAIC